MAEERNTVYSEENIRTIEALEHVRLRPGMYIGKLGDGSGSDDGIYVLLKEVIDNSIDEYVMGAGDKIEISLEDKTITVRDYGRGIPLGKLIECVSIMNTGGKYDNKSFKKSVGLNGVGTKAVNALSSCFYVQAFRDGLTRCAAFEKGKIVPDEYAEEATKEKNGTKIIFTPDGELFVNYSFREDFIKRMLRNYCYLNPGLTIYFNGEAFSSKNGLLDLLNENIDSEVAYPVIHLKGDDIEAAITHSTTHYNEEYHSFVNGQHTSQGGTHLAAFREGFVKVLRDFYGKQFEPADVRKSIIAAISIKVMNPIFESQTKTRLGSTEMGDDKPTVRTYIIDFLSRELDNHLHKNPETASALLRKIQEAERERKDLAGIRKVAKERAKKANLHNKKLRDCRVHLNDKNEFRLDSSIFITEGDSASGSITKARNVSTQAVFSLRGKPLNSFGLTKKVVYENEEFNLLQAALNIEDGIDDLRYNKIIISTDADVDGMHIRLLIMTFFLQFFPEVIEEGHLYILQTPLFRVRDKKETVYCYSEDERVNAIAKLGAKAEITRFKGLGEISPDEFKGFIGNDMRLDPVTIDENISIDRLLGYYMGKNTPDRQDFVVGNLRLETVEGA